MSAKARALPPAITFNAIDYLSQEMFMPENNRAFAAFFQLKDRRFLSYENRTENILVMSIAMRPKNESIADKKDRRSFQCRLSGYFVIN
jgi:hypothetical protein